MTARPCALVVDGGAALEERLDHGVAVVPVRIRIDEQDFVDDGRTHRYPGFYRELRPSQNVATSTPAPGEYLEAFKRSDGDAVICLTIPAKWSAMYDAATLAASMLEAEEGRRRVTVIDTGTAAGGLALVARLAAAACADGVAADAVQSQVAAACRDVRMYGALATLTYVSRSGRVPSLIAGISNSLRVRPVFKLHGGETGRVALTRTSSGAIHALQRAAASNLNGDPQWMLVFHANADPEAQALSESLAEATTVARSETIPLSPISGAYTGPGTIGFASIPVSG